MGAYGAPDVAIAGLLDSFPNVVESAIAQEDIAFGAPVYGMVGVENKAYNYHTEIATVTLSADLVASDNLEVTINGVTLDEDYGTSHAATMTALVAAINGDDDLDALGITASAAGRVLTIVSPANLSLAVTATVTSGGAGTAVATVALSSARKFLGVAVFVQNGGKDWGAGTAGWKNKMSVNILKSGRIWVMAESTVADKDAAYAVTLGAGTVGKFTDVSSNNYDIGSYFRGNVTGGLALLEVRGMK